MENLRNLARWSTSTIATLALGQTPAEAAYSMLQQELDDVKNKNEILQRQEAMRLEDMSKYREAGEIYKILADQKESDLRQKQGLRDDIREEIETSVLEHRYKHTQMLNAQRLWLQAQEIASAIFNRSKTLKGNDHELTRKCQQQLALSLLNQGTDEKLREAKEMYARVWHHRSADSAIERGDPWIIDNGLGFGRALELQNKSQEAVLVYETLMGRSPEAALRLAQTPGWPDRVVKFQSCLSRFFSAGDDDIQRKASRAAIDLAMDLHTRRKDSDAHSVLTQLVDHLNTVMSDWVDDIRREADELETRCRRGSDSRSKPGTRSSKRLAADDFTKASNVKRRSEGRIFRIRM